MQQEIKREQGWLYLSTRLKQVADDDLATSIYIPPSSTVQVKTNLSYNLTSCENKPPYSM